MINKNKSTEAYKKERKQDIDNINSKITENIELLSDLKEVKSSIKENVTSDYVLAHIDKTKEEFITENYVNAEYAKAIIKKYKNGWRYVWSETDMDWIRDDDGEPAKILISDKEKEYIELLADRTFEFFMVQPHLMVILNRNKKDNPMVNKYLKHKDEDEESLPVANMDQRSFFEKIRDKLSGGEEEVIEE